MYRVDLATVRVDLDLRKRGRSVSLIYLYAMWNWALFEFAINLFWRFCLFLGVWSLFWWRQYSSWSWSGLRILEFMQVNLWNKQQKQARNNAQQYFPNLPWIFELLCVIFFWFVVVVVVDRDREINIAFPASYQLLF
jgi:hypothetical protein